MAKQTNTESGDNPPAGYTPNPPNPNYVPTSPTTKDTPDPDPTAYVDGNSIVYLSNDIHNDMRYAPLQRAANNQDLDYVLFEAFSRNKKIGSVTVNITDPVLTITNSSLDLNLVSIIRDKLGLGNGQYDIRVCMYRNYVYTQDSETNEILETGTVQIEEISSTRHEIRVKPTLQKFNNSIAEWGDTSPKQSDFDYDVIWPAILKNTSQNISLISTNWQSIEFDDEVGLDHVVFRLVDPLPKSVKVGNKLQITRDLISPYSIPVIVDFEVDLFSEFTQLRGPHFKAIDVKDKPSRSTMFETWDSIIGSDSATSQRVIDKYISGSDDSELSIDYRSYDNFVHFSSAAERLKNFKYKLELIEQYTSQSGVVTTVQAGLDETEATGSAEFIQNKAMYDSKRDGVISGFDGYEKYLYYESHSTETNTYGTFPAATWPKHTSEKPYTQMHTTGSEAVTWYNSQLTSASLHDDTNISILRNTIPLHILQDSNSDSYVLFVDMIGQHFDTLYNYISHITSVTDRGESIYTGMSKDLIYDTAKSFGWNLQSGFDTSKLWEYALGTDETGSYNSGTTYVTKESYSHEDIEKQTWKRIVNNIPYLLKTKGTARGIKALLNTYGIPNTILQIQEYGGPTPVRVADARREIEKFSYALDFSGSSHISTTHTKVDADKEGTSFTKTSTNRYPSMYEFRFDTHTTQSMHLVSTEATSSDGVDGDGFSRFEVILEHSSSASATSSYCNYGRLVFKLNNTSSTVISTDYAPFYDNDWWNVSFGTKDYVDGPTDTGLTTFEIRYAKIGEHADSITHTGSATAIPAGVPYALSYNAAWGNAGNMLWGGTGSGYSNATYNPFTGSMQEIRGWAEYIGDSAFHQHALSPISIVGDTVQMGYNDLIMRHPLGTDNRTYNHSTTTVLQPTSSLPNVNNRLPFTSGEDTDATFVGWPDSTPYSNKSETYYVSVPTGIGPRAHDNKIRIESNSLEGTSLAHDMSFETSPFDTNALDTDDISIALSPQDQIDMDIAMQFGGFSLDDYIGDPRDRFKGEYRSLRDTKNLYFKKYDNKYNIWAFIRLLGFFNTGIFKQIESLLPARADATVGVVIRPTILERVKIKTDVSMSFEDMYHTGSIGSSVTVVGSNISQSFNNTDFLIHTTTINTGVRASNPTYDIYRQGSEYQYGNYTGSSVQPFVSGSNDAQRNLGTFSGSLSGSHPQYMYSRGLENLIVYGCRMTSPDFNESSPDTIDGAPVVEFILTNPNRLTVSSPSAMSPTQRGGNQSGGPISEITVR